MVQGVVGGVIGGVMNAFSPSAPPTSATAFNPYLNRATTATQAPSTTSSGTMLSSNWNQMSTQDVHSWATSLTGHHVDATDDAGRTISGIVGGMQQTGNTISLNIGGHLVSLSQLKQVSWSPSAV
jgi:hypothetical protein